MKSRILGLVMVVSYVVTGCFSKPTEKEILGLPIVITQTDQEKIDLDLAILNTQKEVKKWLPKANYGNLVFIGDCSQLPELKGKLVVVFVEIHDSDWRPKPQVFYGTAIIYTAQKTFDIRISDESDHYPLTKLYPIPSNTFFQKIVSITHGHLIELGTTNCEVNLIQLEDYWSVHCVARNLSEKKCDFKVDSNTLKIIDNDPSKE